MQTIDLKTVTEANYTMYKVDDNIVYSDAYEQLQILFRKYKSAFARVGECSIPYYWAPTVLKAARSVVTIDPKTIFVNIKEENSKLILDFWFPSGSSYVRDVVYQVKNDIDQLVHDRVRKMLVQRKFLYVPKGFHQQAIPGRCHSDL